MSLEPRRRRRAMYQSSSNTHSSIHWAVFVMKLLDKIGPLNSSSPCSINILGDILHPLLSSYFVVSVFALLIPQGE
jgi:hypothetical protein